MTASRPPNSPTDPDFIGADAALRRAARRALETALQLGTPCWVMEGGQLVDAAARYRFTQGEVTRPTRTTP